MLRLTLLFVAADCLFLVTGDPIESVHRTRGGFGELLVVASRLDRGRVHVVDARRAQVLPAPDAYRAVVISGSAAMLGDKEPWMATSLEFVREAVRRDVPTLGVCFGHQMLGEALGGLVGRNPQGREIGTVTLNAPNASPLMAAGEHWVNATHLDSILALPPGATALASTELEPNALVRFTSTAWGVQFHPEIDREVMLAYIETRAETLAQEGLNPRALAAGVGDAVGGAQVISNFFSHLVDGAERVR